MTAAFLGTALRQKLVAALKAHPILVIAFVLLFIGGGYWMLSSVQDSLAFRRAAVNAEKTIPERFRNDRLVSVEKGGAALIWSGDKTRLLSVTRDRSDFCGGTWFARVKCPKAMWEVLGATANGNLFSVTYFLDEKNGLRAEAPGAISSAYVLAKLARDGRFQEIERLHRLKPFDPEALAETLVRYERLDLLKQLDSPVKEM